MFKVSGVSTCVYVCASGILLDVRHMAMDLSV